MEENRDNNLDENIEKTAEAAEQGTSNAEPDQPVAPEYVYSWGSEHKNEGNVAPIGVRTAGKKASTVAIICLSVLCVALAIFVAALLLSGEEGGLTVAEIAERGSEFTVAIQAKRTSGLSTGTGIILTDNGYIATNYHVVDGAEVISVYTYGGQEYSGTVIDTKPECDLALIRINAHNGERFAYAEIGSYSSVKAGDQVVAIGTPYSINYAWSVSSGCVSHTGRDVVVDAVKNSTVKMIQTDTAANPGNSGGPLINDKCQVIGIVSARLGVDGYENINFAIPISEHMDFFNEGINKDMSKPQIGITGVALAEGKEYYINKEEKKAYTVLQDENGEKYIIINSRYEQKLTDDYMEGGFLITPDRSGILIFGVNENADAYGKLREGDLLVEFDGRELLYNETENPFDTVRDILSEKTSKDSVRVVFIRNGEEYEARISLKEKE
ncbi:MAG: trypsin-like peptidase domain-containing protein [Clostridia bacterium]|nr:trypsin-like peptidase domain-containing protein [Clostridia bacterium]